MTPLIAVHAFAAVTSLVLGGWQLFFSAKGTPAHRMTGRVWVVLMLFVSVSSFWIQDLRPGHFSFLHVLSVVTVVTVALGVFDAIRGNLASHRGNMTGSWIGLCFAGVFAVAIPQRAIPQFLMSDPGEAALAAVLVLSSVAAVVRLGAWANRATSRQQGALG